MRTSGDSSKLWWVVLLSLMCASGMWLYMQRVLIAYQIADAQAHSRPRGNLSDLYPRWLGARELLLYGRDPYSDDVTREIQAGYYGRPLDASNPSDPRDQQAFAYPVYVVFYLAPTVRMPFGMVQRVFFWMLVAVTAVSVALWIRMLRWPLSHPSQIAVLVLVFGSLAVVQGLKLQQITLLVAAMMAGAVALVVADRLVFTGILLGLATIKPQVVCLLLLWLAIWTLGDWKRRYRWMVSFLITVAILAGASELVLPHWIPRFWHAMHDYLHYTEGVPLLHKLLPTPWNWIVEIAAGGGAVLVCWTNRRQTAEARIFAATTCLVLAVTLLLVPSYALYNQVLLVPTILLVARERYPLWQRSAVIRALLGIGVTLLLWHWMAGLVLAVLSFVARPEWVQRGWAVPAWATPTLPLAAAALVLSLAYPGSMSASRSTIPS